MRSDVYLILTLNTAHPTSPHAFFLQCEEDEEGYSTDFPLVFQTYEDAKEWVNENKGAPFAFTILATSDFIYH